MKSKVLFDFSFVRLRWIFTKRSENQCSKTTPFQSFLKSMKKGEALHKSLLQRCKATYHYLNITNLHTAVYTTPRRMVASDADLKRAIVSATGIWTHMEINTLKSLSIPVISKRMWNGVMPLVHALPKIFEMTVLLRQKCDAVTRTSMRRVT